jgi:serine protease Do
MVAGEPAGIRLTASPNQADFAANWGVPGVALSYSTSLSTTLSPEALLDTFDYARTCEDAGREQLAPGARSVLYQIWLNCAASKSAAVVMVVSPVQTRDYYAVVEVYMSSLGDVTALGHILSTLQINAGAAASAQPAQPDSQGEQPASTVIPVVVAPPVPAPTPTPTPVVPVQATVLADRLNVRSGPTVDVARLGVATRGTVLNVYGQTGNCAWLQVTTPDGLAGWVSGDPRYVSLPIPCASLAPAP